MKKIKFNKSVKKKIILLLVVLVFILFLYVGGIMAVMLNSVRNMCRDASSEQQGDCVGNLQAMLMNPERSFASKNAAIWALGQIADPKALPTLEALAAVTPTQDNCRRFNQLCSVEITKAIKWCRQGNLTSWLYKGRANW